MNHHKRILILLAAVVRILATLLLATSALLSSFDSSAEVVIGESWLKSLLRWDVFQFLHIAEKGYVFEYEWAFFPGLPLLLRFSTNLIRYWLPNSSSEKLLLVMGAVGTVLVDGTLTLYDLTEHVFHSHSFAFLAALLSLLPSSPATLRLAPYTEPFFTYLSYKGMLFCARRQWTRASLAFTLASAFRSNGAILPIFLLWGIIIQPFLQHRHMPKLSTLVLGIVYCALPLIPTIAHQYIAYRAFCQGDIPPKWCSNLPPSIYTHAQSTYWNVGPFRYWTLQQLPNILLAMPVLALLFYGSVLHIRYGLYPRLKGEHPPQGAKDPFFDLSVTPHAIHALLLATILLVSSHTQIALRLASSLPFLYWSAAHLWTSGKQKAHGKKLMAAKWWTGWSLVWGTISVVLWGVFLPPA